MDVSPTKHEDSQLLECDAVSVGKWFLIF